jgi:GTP-binding protein HflX
VLGEIGCADKPILLVLNKADVVPIVGQLEMLQALHQKTATISARTGMGLTELSEIVCEKVRSNVLYLRVTFSVADGRILSFLRARAEVLSENFNEHHVIVEAVLGQHLLPGLKRLNPERIDME